MTLHVNKIGLAALSLAIIGIAAPVRSIAQDGGGGTKQTEDIMKTNIDIDLESTNLYYGLKLLFSQVKANFTIDESLKSLTVTAHLTQVPFRVALETLLKSTSTPLTYKIENGIYSVVQKVEVAEDVTAQATSDIPVYSVGGYIYGIIRPNNVAAIDIVTAFGGHIVNVGYTPSTFGRGGLGGGNGQSGGLGGGGVGGFGGGSSGFGGGSNGYGGYGNTGGSGSQMGSGQNGSAGGGNNSGGFSGLHGF